MTIQAVLFDRDHCEIKQCLVVSSRKEIFNIFTLNDKIESFTKKKNQYSKIRIENNSIEMFSSVDNLIIERNHCKCLFEILF